MDIIPTFWNRIAKIGAVLHIKQTRLLKKEEKAQKRAKKPFFCQVTKIWRHCAKMVSVTSNFFSGYQRPLPGVPPGTIG